jgi:hypothetical protein
MSATKPKVTNVAGGTQFPMIKAISTNTSTIIAKITYAEALRERQIKALRNMYASYKQRCGFKWMVALGINGREVTFQVYAGKPIPPKKEVWELLEALGLAEINYVPTAPKKPIIKPAAKKPSRPASGSSARTTP